MGEGEREGEREEEIERGEEEEGNYGGEGDGRGGKGDVWLYQRRYQGEVDMTLFWFCFPML